MQRIVCIFAHPDDEAFGPGGTIALLAKTCEVYLICVTNGDDSRLPKAAAKDLGKIRREELKRSARILGVKSVDFLDYQDGKLANIYYHEIAEKLTEKVVALQADTIVTFEPRGVSGHLDHIAVSMICSYIFENIPSLRTLLYYCISAAERAIHGSYFIYFPPGYEKAEIDMVYDVSSVWVTKVAAMREHVSQASDATRILERSERLPKEECFLVKRKI